MKHTLLKVLLTTFIFGLIVIFAPITYAEDGDTEQDNEPSALAQAFELNASNIINYIATGVAYVGTAIGSVGVISSFFKKKKKQADELLDEAKSKYSDGLAKTNDLVNTYRNDFQTLINELNAQIGDLSNRQNEIKDVSESITKIKDEVSFLYALLKEYLLNDTASVKDGIAQKVDYMVNAYEQNKASQSEE